MIVHVSTRDLLIIQNWEVITKIKEFNDGNTNKYWIRELPGFNEVDFPFIICSGWETFNLININDFHMETLVKASVKNGIHQEAAFFNKEDYGFSMHFASQRIISRGKNLQQWHRMAFREDFIETL